MKIFLRSLVSSAIVAALAITIGAAVLLSTTRKDLSTNAQAAEQQKVADVTLEYGQKLQAITSKFEANIPLLQELGCLPADRRQMAYLVG
jgi:hypothetical protein